MTTQESVQVHILEDQVAQEFRAEALPLSESRWFLESGVAYAAYEGIEMVAFWVDGRVAVKMAADGYYFCDTYVDDISGVQGLEDFTESWTPLYINGWQTESVPSPGYVGQSEDRLSEPRGLHVWTTGDAG